MRAIVDRTESSLSTTTLKWSSELKMLGVSRYLCQLQSPTPAAEATGCILCNEPVIP